MIMPDHIHIVARLKPGWRLEQIMHTLKSFTGKRISEQSPKGGQVWQDGYYEHCIRDERALREIILYCYYNPVRKGLVKRPEDYPYWWCKYRL
jgi:REP element-mobilizing transposase RayT